MCTVYSVQLYSGHRVYSAVQAAPTGSGVTRVRAQSRPVRRQTPASEQTSGPGRHWTLDSQTLQAFIIRRTLPRWAEGIMSLFLLCWHSVFGHKLSKRFRV